MNRASASLHFCCVIHSIQYVFMSVFQQFRHRIAWLNLCTCTLWLYIYRTYTHLRWGFFPPIQQDFDPEPGVRFRASHCSPLSPAPYSLWFPCLCSHPLPPYLPLATMSPAGALLWLEVGNTEYMVPLAPAQPHSSDSSSSLAPGPGLKLPFPQQLLCGWTGSESSTCSMPLGPGPEKVPATAGATGGK